jgi:hypothetical protein
MSPISLVAPSSVPEPPPTADFPALIGPSRAIRAKCVDCKGGEWSRVTACKSPDCDLYTRRAGHGLGRGGHLRAIRAFCLWCCLGSAHEVRLCPASACPLWPYRSGHRPKPIEPDAPSGNAGGAAEAGATRPAEVRYHPAPGLSRPDTGSGDAPGQPSPPSRLSPTSGPLLRKQAASDF